jgi:hypothetical protein
MENEYKITSQGSLGLLALGHIGILKWKEAKEADKFRKKVSSKQTINDTKKK